MSIEVAMELIEDTGLVFNIGQLDKATKRELDRRVRRNELAKIRTIWPWRHFGLAEKTAYCFPHAAKFYSVK